MTTTSGFGSARQSAIQAINREMKWLPVHGSPADSRLFSCFPFPFSRQWVIIIVVIEMYPFPGTFSHVRADSI